MNQLFKKLQLKDHTEVLILNKPEGFDDELEMPEGFVIEESLIRVTKITFALVFVTSKIEIVEQMETLAPKLQGDAILWFAYPKKSSKKYSSELSRDHGWTPLGNHRYEPVRAIAVDEDWTALRFRKVEFIKKMTRNKGMTLSGEGRQKTTGR